MKVGDRVAIEPGIPCRRCVQCRTGRYNLCPDVKFLATPPYDGSLAQYIVHDADFCFVRRHGIHLSLRLDALQPVPDHVSFEEAALLEPLSVGVFACERGQITAGQRVLITGAGIIPPPLLPYLYLLIVHANMVRYVSACL